MNPLSLTLLAALAVPADDHEKANPIYRDLRQTGVAVGAAGRVRLPAPTMADGLSADAQEGVLKAVIGQDYSLDEFTRPSPVAPHCLQMHDPSPSDPKAPSRAVDVYFVAYGDLKTAASREFLERVLEMNREGGKAHTLEPGELARRRIRANPDDKQEGYAYFSFPMLDRVELSGVGHSYWDKGQDSLVAAGELDSRFRGDADFPNQWRPLGKDGDGPKRPGAAEPYDGVGYYVKVTRLARPKGALFVECHLIFTEPRGWFGGANLLRSKLPPAIQSQVRSFRRELKKASR
jgi:hypothetical protein